MDELTADDRGVFLVETQGSVHRWTITDEGVSYVRKSQRENPSGLNHYNGKSISVYEVPVWPKVGGVFFVRTRLYSLPWHQSSTIKSITRVEA